MTATIILIVVIIALTAALLAAHIAQVVCTRSDMASGSPVNNRDAGSPAQEED